MRLIWMTYLIVGATLHLRPEEVGNVCSTQLMDPNVAFCLLVGKTMRRFVDKRPYLYCDMEFATGAARPPEKGTAIVFLGDNDKSSESIKHECQELADTNDEKLEALIIRTKADAKLRLFMTHGQTEETYDARPRYSRTSDRWQFLHTSCKWNKNDESDAHTCVVPPGQSVWPTLELYNVKQATTALIRKSPDSHPCDSNVERPLQPFCLIIKGGTPDAQHCSLAGDCCDVEMCDPDIEDFCELVVGLITFIRKESDAKSYCENSGLDFMIRKAGTLNETSRLWTGGNCELNQRRLGKVTILKGMPEYPHEQERAGGWNFVNPACGQFPSDPADCNFTTELETRRLTIMRLTERFIL